MTATSERWKGQRFGPMRRLSYHDTFSADETARIKAGRVPKSMEDKWFISVEDPLLVLHRSWTGQAVYNVRLKPHGSGCRIAEAQCSVDMLERSNVQDQARLLRFLVDNLLLGREGVPAPLLRDGLSAREC